MRYRWIILGASVFLALGAMANPDFYHWNGGARLTLSLAGHGVLIGTVWSGRATPMPWCGPIYGSVW